MTHSYTKEHQGPARDYSCGPTDNVTATAGASVADCEVCVGWGFVGAGPMPGHGYQFGKDNIDACPECTVRAEAQWRRAASITDIPFIHRRCSRDVPREHVQGY